MKGSDRLRRLASYAFVAALVVAAVSCNEAHPNSTLDPHSDLGREIDFLWDRLLLLGTIVFILVEGVLLYVVFRYRRRENQGTPPQTHGSTKLEIAWTLIPAVILVFIAVPTVRTIFITQAQAAPGSLNIDVTGHQWWWEFRYPDYGVTTANEIYLPVGRTVNFRLRSADVIHSFWTPQLGGKRDVVTNRTNYIWYTPDSAISGNVWNGFCVEYCGASHANMRFRVFTVTQQQFESWVAGQRCRRDLAPFSANAKPRCRLLRSTKSARSGPASRREFGHRPRWWKPTGDFAWSKAAANPGSAPERDGHRSPRRPPARCRPVTSFRARRFPTTRFRMRRFPRISNSPRVSPEMLRAASRFFPARPALGVIRSLETPSRWA